MIRQPSWTSTISSEVAFGSRFKARSADSLLVNDGSEGSIVEEVPDVDEPLIASLIPSESPLGLRRLNAPPIAIPASVPSTPARSIPSVNGLPSARFLAPCSSKDCGSSSKNPSDIAPPETRAAKPR